MLRKFQRASAVHIVDNIHRLSTIVLTAGATFTTTSQQHLNTTKRLIMMVINKRVLSY